MAKAIPFRAGLFGAGSADNGILMLTSPEAWYLVVPGVPSMVPFNRPVPRDIGLILVLVGARFVFGVVRSSSSALLLSRGAIWPSGHAPVHVREVAMGFRGPEVRHRDFLAVTFPALSVASLNDRSFRHADHR